MSIDAATLRNILAAMRNIDRHELPKMGHEDWGRFLDDPYLGFLLFSDEHQQAIAAIVKAKVTPPDTRTQDEKDYEFDRLLGGRSI